MEVSLYFGEKLPIYIITVRYVEMDFDDHKFTQGGEKSMNTVQSDSYAANAYAQNTTKTQKEDTSATKKSSQTKNYGKTIGEPKLSDEAAKYYDQLKSKFGNMDFILVSKDMKEQAKAMASSFANPNKMVVLIDEEKLERMATDEAFRNKYEGIIANAKSGLSQLKQSIGSNQQVKGYGMLLNDGGNASFFAVIDKSLAAQKKRIEKKAAEKKAAEKADAKKQEKKKAEEKRKEAASEKADKTSDENGKTYRDTLKDYGIEEDDDTIIIAASSAEELERLVNDYFYSQRSNQVMTPQEKLVGQNMDFRL